jgi:hypothetical protein
MVRGNTHGGGIGAQKTFGRLLTAIYYLEGELCVSDNLEDSKCADEESELSSILVHTTLGNLHCQPQASQGRSKKTRCGARINLGQG